MRIQKYNLQPVKFDMGTNFIHKYLRDNIVGVGEGPPRNIKQRGVTNL